MRIFILVFLFVFSLAGCQSGDRNTKKGKNPVTAADSLEIVTEMIRQDSSDYQLYLQRAHLNVELGKIDPAFRDVNRALELNSQAPETFVLLSDLYFIMGNAEDAIAALKKAAELNPRNEVPYIKLAETYLILKNYSMAQKSTDVALSINVNNEQAYFLKGVAFMEQGDTVNAVTNLRISANLDTNNFAAYMQLAAIYQQQHDSVAINYYKDALKARPDDEKALFGLARFCQELGRLDEALTYYNKVNELYPGNKEAWFNSGYIYLVEKEDYTQALHYFKQAVYVDPAYVEAVYNLGRTYEAQGKYDEAAAQYRQALELHTNYPLAIEGLNRMHK
jgi:superkiller protein 3